jgi:predicted amidophosphoribosyltransferase
MEYNADMSLTNAIFGTVLEALFPVPAAEREVLAMGDLKAWTTLPRAKRFPTLESCSIFAYKDERVWRLIWAIKYKRSKPGAMIAAYALHRILRLYASVTPPILVVPMPITRKRRRERGYNQCELILDEIEKLENERHGIDETKPIDIGGGMAVHSKKLTFVRDLLIRVRHTSRQTLKDRAERLESAEDIFAVDFEALEQLRYLNVKTNLSKSSDSGNNSDTENQWMKDLLVIIIDDVVTTGSTMRDAVQTLRRAGFVNTFGLSVAH